MLETQVADLFCGPGGMSLGFSEHFNVSLAIDWMPDPCKTYKHNINNNVRQRDITNLSGCRKDFDGMIGIIAGPPCKPFSRLNLRKDPHDPRRNLWRPFMRLVEEVDPQFLLMENVPTIDNDIKKAIIREARRLGYIVTHAILDSSDYGVPQKRRRWIVVGTKRPFAFPGPTNNSRTVRTAFAKIKNNHGFGKPRPETKRRFSKVPTGKWAPIAGGKFRNATRLAWDRPSPTIVNIRKVYMIHPSRNRIITETEAAVLQDFPHDFWFAGNRTSRTQQIADAAPPSLMKAIAHQIKRTQFKGE